MTTPVGVRKVLVTGGGTGIGRAVTEAIVAAGGSVVVSGRRAEPLQAVSSAFPGRVFPLVADVASSADRDGLLERASGLLGGLDGFVHSAGQVVHQPPGAISEEALRSQLEVNFVAPLRLSEQALQLLPDGGGVVFVASTLAERPIVTSAAYSASKAGLLAAMKSFAMAGAARRIRFNAVLPGIVETEMVADRIATHGDEMRALHPLGRLGQPQDIAAAVLHLLGAGWTTGAALVVDGGLLLRE